MAVVDNACSNSEAHPATKMSAETINILVVSVLVPLLVAFVAVFQQYAASKSSELKTKLHNAEIEKYIKTAEDAVATAVGAVNQKLVDDYKEFSNNGKLTDEQQKQVFTEAKHRAMLIMGVAGKAAVTELYGSFDDWIDNKIDYYVGLSKLKKKHSLSSLRIRRKNIYAKET